MGQQIEALAKFVAETRWENIPAPVQQHAKLVLLDTIGVILAGSVRPEVAALRRLLKRTDRWLSKRQLTRLPGETLHQFAGRLQVAAADETALRPVAEWYRAWATLRYGGEIDAARVAELQRAAAGLGI